MSERDNRMKYNRDNNIKSSMYDRVNAGRNNANNKLDGPHLTHVGGSMNNPDEERTDVTSFSYQFFFYLIGIGLSTALIFIGYLVLRERFFSVGMNQLLPSFLLVSISLVIGFYSSEKIVATFKK